MLDIYSVVELQQCILEASLYPHLTTNPPPSPIGHACLVYLNATQPVLLYFTNETTLVTRQRLERYRYGKHQSGRRRSWDHDLLPKKLDPRTLHKSKKSTNIEHKNNRVVCISLYHCIDMIPLYVDRHSASNFELSNIALGSEKDWAV